MNAKQVARLLAKVAAFDNRTIGDATILAWTEALADVDYRDAMDAVTAHFRQSTDWLMPAHVRRGVAELALTRRRAQADAAHDRAIEADGIASITRRFARPEALIAALRDTLPPGNPAKLRGPHWLAANGRGQLRENATGGGTGWPQSQDPGLATHADTPQPPEAEDGGSQAIDGSDT